MNRPPRVEPLRRAWAEALMEGDVVFADRFTTVVVPGWAGFPHVLPALLEGARRQDGDPWGSHLIFDGTDGALVGLGGFKGAPAEGEVEIGYAIAPARQGRGLATAAVGVLIGRALGAGVRTVVAHTLAEPNPSTSVLVRHGFRRVGTLHDGDLGRDVWRWALEDRGSPGARVTPKSNAR